MENSTQASPVDQKIQRYFKTLSQNRDFSGVILIGDYQDILHQYSFGFANFEEEKPHTPLSRFGIASLTKTFTAAAILKLKDEGLLNLEDKISRFLPDFQYGDDVTVLNLLRHESGLSNLEERLYGSRFLSTDELINEIGNKPLLFEPGTDGSYSNSGFSMLASIVEKVSNQSFEQYLEENFFNQHSMSNSGDRIYLNEEESICTPYFPSPPPGFVKKISGTNPSLSLGSGSFYSTVIDLWQWGKAIGQKEIVNVFAEDYPYGWGRDSIAGYFSLNQTGMHKGYVSALHIIPDQEIIIILLSNIENGMWSDWAKDLARIYFKQEKEVFYPEERLHYQKEFSRAEIEEFIARYRMTPSRFVDIRNKGSHLYLHLNAHHQGNYLAPLSPQTFDLRSFSGQIKFSDNKDTLYWNLPQSWGGSVEKYIRE